MVGIITVFCQLLEKLIILEKTLHVFKDIYQHIKRLWLTKNKIQKKGTFKTSFKIIKKRELPPRQRRPPKMYGYDEYV